MNIVLIGEGEDFIPSSDERTRHIRKVLHMGEGDSFRAGIPGSMMGHCTILSSGDDGIRISFTAERDGSALYPLTLIVAQVRPICMRRILREAVSLGVGRIILPVSDLGEKSYLSASLYRDREYEGILLDGAMQSGFTGVSSVSIVDSAEAAISIAEGDELILLDNAVGAVPLSQADLRGRSCVLAIGPERGWSERERRLFIGSGYSPMLLGCRILRTETAAVAGCAMALSRMGFI